ncbi:P-loop containing nucleoside triphosphate hydrolase protein, partial [Phakopsora pachyrhizi]
RTNPNILITGTPGTGKTTHTQQLVQRSSHQRLNLTPINIADFAKQNDCYESYDEEWESWIVDEDRLLDSLEPIMSSELGGVILDWHCSEIFPERWIDLVVVLRTDHQELWKRLESRNYSLRKIQENNQAEIMNECLDEAMENYEIEQVVELQSGDLSCLEKNVERILRWIEDWKND